MRPRHLCSRGEGEDRRVVRYSTASWRMMLPCLSMQQNPPKKNLPSLIPTSIRRNSSFLARPTASDPSPTAPSSVAPNHTLFRFSTKTERQNHDFPQAPISVYHASFRKFHTTPLTTLQLPCLLERFSEKQEIECVPRRNSKHQGFNQLRFFFIIILSYIY